MTQFSTLTSMVIPRVPLLIFIHLCCTNNLFTSATRHNAKLTSSETPTKNKSQQRLSITQQQKFFKIDKNFPCDFFIFVGFLLFFLACLLCTVLRRKLTKNFLSPKKSRFKDTTHNRAVVVINPRLNI